MFPWREPAGSGAACCDPFPHSSYGVRIGHTLGICYPPPFLFRATLVIERWRNFRCGNQIINRRAPEKVRYRLHLNRGTPDPRTAIHWISRGLPSLRCCRRRSMSPSRIASAPWISRQAVAEDCGRRRIASRNWRGQPPLPGTRRPRGKMDAPHPFRDGGPFFQEQRCGGERPRRQRPRQNGHASNGYAQR